MVKAFEKEGFTVTKHYIPDKRAYRFNICKDNVSSEMEFAWITTWSNQQNHERQERFIKHLIGDWENNYEESHSLPAKTRKEYILHVNTWDGSRKKCDEQVYVVNDVSINDEFFSAGVVIPKIKDVIFNGPATIVKWSDGTKTVVKCCKGDLFDPEKGLAMAISKKALGDCKEIKKWTEKYEAPPTKGIIIKVPGNDLVSALNNLKKRWNEAFGL